MLFKSDKGLMSYARSNSLFIRICAALAVITLITVSYNSCEQNKKIDEIRQTLKEQNEHL